MERAVYATKSFIISLALVKGRISVEQAAQASHVEVNSQIKKWGEVEDCEWALAFAIEETCVLISYRFSAHDVDHRDIRRQLGSVACLLAKS